MFEAAARFGRKGRAVEAQKHEHNRHEMEHKRKSIYASPTEKQGRERRKIYVLGKEQGTDLIYGALSSFLRKRPLVALIDISC